MTVVGWFLLVSLSASTGVPSVDLAIRSTAIGNVAQTMQVSRSGFGGLH